MFPYDVMTEEQAMQQRFSLLKAGDYDAVVIHSEDKTSSSGNPMMTVKLSVYDEAGLTHDLVDYLVFTPKMMWKVIKCAQSAGLQKEYDSQQFCSEVLMDRTIRVKIDVEEGKLIPDEKLGDKAPGARYPDRNIVKEYLPNDKQGIVSPVARPANLEDDVPF